jgi:hypothetical protein
MQFLSGLSPMLLATLATAARHHPILPEPQELTYCRSAFPLSGMEIGFGHDLFRLEHYADMLDAVVELKEMFQQAWLNEYTTFRLQRQLDEVRQHYQAGDFLPSLESLFR